MERIDSVLEFWFGHVEQTVIPSEARAKLWFGDSQDIDNAIKDQFYSDYNQLVNKESSGWNGSGRGRLAKIIMLDQFTRHLHRGTPKAFEMDKRALEACLQGIRNEEDHQLSLIERAFFYFPLLHSEKLVYQEQAVMAYSALAELAFDETKIIYESFLKFANHHYTIIQRFGRFPERNHILGRTPTAEEIEYLENKSDKTEPL